MPAFTLNPRTQSRLWWWLVLVVCVGALVYLLARRDGALTPVPAPATQQQIPGAMQPLPRQAGEGDTDVLGVEQLSGQKQALVSPLNSVKPPQFKANDKGQLVIDEAFRVDLERVYALYHGPDVLKKLEEFSAHLPDKARQDLRNQYQRYVQYDAAVMQSMTSLKTQEEMTLELAERELAQLHELRQTYFGEEAAKAMFAQEEAHSKELHDYIRQHTDPALPMMQRVELAQAAWLQSRQTPETLPASAK